MEKFFFCNLKTTGVDERESAIVELEAIIDVDGEVKEDFALQFKPFKGYSYEKKALIKLRNEGISLEQMLNFPEESVGYSKLLELFERYVDRFNSLDKMFFVGFVALFNDRFLRKLFERQGDDYYGSWFWWPPIDLSTVACLDMLEERPSIKSFSLPSVLDWYGITGDTKVHEIRNLFYKIM